MEEVLNVKELTKYLRCSDSTVRKLIKTRKYQTLELQIDFILRKN